MDLAILVVVAGVSGYHVFFQTNALRHIHMRQHGGHLFYQSVGLGLLLLLLSYLVACLLNRCVPSLALLGEHPAIHHSTTFLVLIMLTFAVPLLANLYWTKARVARDPAIARGGAIEQVLQDGIATSTPVEVITRGGSVYVGFVIDTGIPSPSSHSYISLLPLAAGRCDSSLSPDYTENWAEALRDPRALAGPWSPKHWVIAFPKDDVVLIRHVDISLFTGDAPPLQPAA